MSQPPMMKAGCTCQAKGPKVTLIDMGKGIMVGLVGMEEAFERFCAQGREPSPELGAELLAAIKAQNYVARSVEDQYKLVLLREYASYCQARS
jgi:hypothetical protein